MIKKIILLISLLLLIVIPIVYADGWTSDKPSHSTLYVDTLTSKTDASSVNVADSLFTTGDITTLGKVGIGTTSPSSPLHVYGGSGADQFLVESGLNTGTGIRLRALSSAGGQDYQLVSTASGNSEGAGKLLIANNGGVRAVVDSSGNVGIGTTSPLENLHIKDSDGTAIGMRLEYPVGGKSGISFYEGATARAFMQWSGADNKMFFYTGGGDVANRRLTIQEDGNVGIGTTSPNVKLHVSGANTEQIVESTNAGGDSSIRIGNSNTPQYWEWRTFGTGGNFALRDATSNNYRLWVDKTTGNVGIGTTSPTALLDLRPPIGVKGIGIQLPTTDGGVNFLEFRYSSGGVGGYVSAGPWPSLVLPHGYSQSSFGMEPWTVGEGATLSVAQGLPNRVALVVKGYYSDGSPAAALQQWMDAANNVLMTVKASGNVGIGTTTPTEKLDVYDGNILVERTNSGVKGLVILTSGGFAKPTCDVTIQGAITYEQNLGTNNGHFFGCRGAGGGSYAWVQLD